MAPRFRSKLPTNVSKAIVCGPIPKLRNWRKRLADGKTLTDAEKVMAFSEEYLRVPEGKYTGDPIRLQPFQEAFFYSVFDNPHKTRTAILSMGRKNSKTVTSAMILLAYICGPFAAQNKNNMICSGAMGREQAALVFKHMCAFINANEELQDVCRIIPSGKRIVGLRNNVEYQALAKEGSTTVGRSDKVILGDEWGQIKGPNDAFVDALLTSQGAHDNPLVLMISTQAADDGDYLSTVIDDAITSQNPQVVCHLYAAEKDAEVLDKQAWADANPAIGIFRSLEDVRTQAEQASRQPSSEARFRNLILNQRVTTHNPFVSKDVWLANNQPIDKELFFDGRPVYCGLDLSMRNDLTAFVAVTEDDEGYIHVWPFCFTPGQGLQDRQLRDRAPYDVWIKQGHLLTTPGATIDYAEVIRIIADAGLNVTGISFDRWRIDLFQKELDSLGIYWPMTPHGQGFRDMSPAIGLLEEALLANKVKHGGHPVLTWCASNTISDMDPAGNTKFVKALNKERHKIDPMVALAMAFGNKGKDNNISDVTHWIA